MFEEPRVRCQLRKASLASSLPKENKDGFRDFRGREEVVAKKRRRKKAGDRSGCRRESDSDSCCDSRASWDDAGHVRLTPLRKGTGSDRSDPESDFADMPVESSKSVLKSSFSLSSLRPSPVSDSPDQGIRMPTKNERPYHSLTKQSRQRHHQLEREMWRKSWGSVIGQDDKQFSEAFQADYDYLMSQNILEKDGEYKSYSTPAAPQGWSFSEFNNQFAQLCSWLSDVQDSVDSKMENVTDWKIRAERQESLQRYRFRLDNFNEESKRLIERFPDLEREITYYVKFVNETWEKTELMTGGGKMKEGQRRKEEETRDRVKNELRCLRKWLRGLNTKLKPLTFKQTWTESEMERMAKEHSVLHCDIESHSYVVSSVVKLCEKLDPSSLITARALQRKYFEHRIKSLEWKCYFETLNSDQSPTVASDSDGEPGAKKLKVYHSFVNDSEEEITKDKTFDFDETRSYSKELQLCAFDRMVVVDSKSPCDRSGGGITENSSSERAPIDGISNGRNAAATAGTVRDDAMRSTPAGLSSESRNRGVEGSAIEDFVPVRTKGRQPNIGEFNYKHQDTDQGNSEEEKENRSVGDAKDADTTSSEDGFTFSKEPVEKESLPDTRRRGKPNAAVRLDFGGGTAASSESTEGVTHRQQNSKNAITSNTVSNEGRPRIQDLVDEVDEMIRCRSTNSSEGKSSRNRIRCKGGEASGTLDSYDASSECTAEDSDDIDGSVATCRRFGSAEGIPNEFSSAKSAFFGVVMRNSKHRNKTRPSSMSCVPSYIGQEMNDSGAQLSFSESALNQMPSKDYSFGTNGREKKLQWHESGSLRRRRMRARKRSFLNRRSDSCAAEGTPNGNESPQSRSSPNKQFPVRGIVKSDSFSGSTPKATDKPKVEGPSDERSASETDEDVNKTAGQLFFRLGPDGGEVTIANERSKSQGEEQLSLSSDQVDWDNYQEKYQSEAYSEEPPDQDALRRVTEFGEDYWEDIGVQPGKELRLKRGGDLSFPEDNLHRNPTGRESEMVQNSSNAFDDTVINRKFLHCRDSLDDCAESTDAMLEGFYLLEGHCKMKYEPNNGAELEKEMTSLKKELRSLVRIVDETETVVKSRDELETKIERLKGKLNAVRELKFKLGQLNYSVHRFLCDTGQASCSTKLKEEIGDLYQTWNLSFREVSAKLCTLQRILQMWQELEELLVQFQTTLRSDQDVLRTLDYALCDSPASHVSFSVKDVARMLFDKESSSKNHEYAFEGALSKQERSIRPPILASLCTESSLSDSGISDSGSEQEMCEREKKLARLKKLQKDLEDNLVAESPELALMARKIGEAEEELRRLQKKRRDLLEKTVAEEEEEDDGDDEDEEAEDAVGKKFGANVSSGFRALPLRLGKSKRSRSRAEDADEEMSGKEFDEDDEVGRPGRSRFWRVVRAAVPFQLALVALFCVACLLEPNCCDMINNLGMPFAQQLRYNRSPPPT